MVEGRRGGEPELGRVSPRPLLETQGLTRYFGGLAAVDHVDLTVSEGEIVGLIGPNGAGKTTLLDAISGYARATGSVELGGRKLDALKPYQRSRHGMGRTFQGIELYDDLSVRENVEVGTIAARSDRADREQPAAGRCCSAVGRTRRMRSPAAARYWTSPGCPLTPISSRGISPTATSARSESRWPWPRDHGSCCSTSR